MSGDDDLSVDCGHTAGEERARGERTGAGTMRLQGAALLCCALGAEGVPLGHARRLLVYDPSGMHLAILLMVRLAWAAGQTRLAGFDIVMLVLRHLRMCCWLSRVAAGFPLSSLSLSLSLSPSLPAGSAAGAYISSLTSAREWHAFIALTVFCFLFRGTSRCLLYA